MTEQMINDPNALNQYIDLTGAEGAEFIVEIINDFLEGAPGSFSELDESLAGNDFATFRRAAHSMKTGCATLGATELGKKFLALEEAGATGNLSSVDQALKICKAEFQKLKAELENKVSTLS